MASPAITQVTDVTNDMSRHNHYMGWSMDKKGLEQGYTRDRLDEKRPARTRHVSEALKVGTKASSRHTSITFSFP